MFLAFIASVFIVLNLSPIPKPALRFVYVVGISYEILSIDFFTFGNLWSYANDHFLLDAGDAIVSYVVNLIGELP